MANVSFNEPQYDAARARPQKQSLLTRLVLALGLAKTPAGAQTVLLIVAIASIVAAAGIYLMTNSPGSGAAAVHAPSPNEL
jgi:hypothetical protein